MENNSKVFISVGMSGRDEKDVRNDIMRISNRIIGLGFDGITIIHNYDCVRPADCENNHLWYLGEAIKQLGECDVCYFCKGWENHRGCLVEFEVCKLYDIEIIFER